MADINENPESPSNAAGSTDVIAVQRICLDFQSRAGAYRRRLLAFLEKHRHELDLSEAEDLAGAYLGRVWPPEVPSNLIVSNASFDQFGRWLIRPPVDGPNASSYAAAGLAPAFSAYRKKGRLVVDSFHAVLHVPPRPFEVRVSAEVCIDPIDTYMTSADLDTLSALPSPRKAAAERLGLWIKCIDWLQKLVQLDRVAFRYHAFEATRDGHLRFFIHGKLKTKDLRRRIGAMLLAAPLSASQSVDRWDPQPEQRPPFVLLGELARFDVATDRAAGVASKNRRSNQTRCAPNANGKIALTVKVEDVDQLIEERAIPNEGFLVSAVGGDLKPLNNERRAIERLRKGQSHNPYLADWLFDIQNAAYPQSIPDRLTEREPSRPLNTDQRAAVNKSMAADDCCPIQGPPGTGKTTVIAETTEQTVHAGGRVLIASQTNVAVDNVLAQLTGCPEIRPLRVGKTERVEPEFRRFLEENVVPLWFSAIALNCVGRMQERDGELHRQRMAEEAFSHLQQILRRAEESRAQLTTCEQQLRKLGQQGQAQQKAKLRAAAESERLLRRRQALTDLVTWMDSGVGPPSVELIADTPAAKALVKAAEKLQHALMDNEWELPWLPRHGSLSPQAALNGLHVARLALRAVPALETSLAEAEALCKGSRSVDRSSQASQLRELQAEREQLLTSEREEDLARVAGINRELNHLRGERWSAVCRSIRQHLGELFQGPSPRELDELTSSLGPDRKWTDAIQAVQAFGDRLRKGIQSSLDKASPRIRELIANAVQRLDARAEAARTQAGARENALSELEQQISTAAERLEQATTDLRECELRWSQAWPEVCVDLETPETAPAMAPAQLQAREGKFRDWLDQHTARLGRSQRWRPILEEWVQRLGDPASPNRQSLRSQYVRHANVVGLTCNEAGQRDFYDHPDFEPFDVVIIDEVSKATPPELLMPMLLGRKVILVGDPRQLPPMIREHEASYEEAVAEGLIIAEDFGRFRKLVTSSYFAELFQAAPDSLRQALVITYRPHSQLRNLTNQFYDDKLVSGPDEETLDRRRQHHLCIRDIRGGWFLEKHQHVLWADSTKDHRGRFVREQQHGSSKANALEVELVAQTLLRLNGALRERGYGPPRRAVADGSHAKISVREWAEQSMPSAAPETIDDLFAKKRVKLNGHASRADDHVHAGDTLELDARKAVAVITFYGAQIRAIRQRIQQIQGDTPDSLAAIDLRSNTVDRFQGMEQPIVLVSLVRARPVLRGGEYVRNYQRINVALSRAQELLVIIGSERTYRDALVELPSMDGGSTKQVPVYRNIYELVKRYGGRRYANQLIR